METGWSLFLFFVFINLLVVTTTFDVASIPRDVAGRYGDLVQLNCTTNLIGLQILTWQMIPPGASSIISIYSGTPSSAVVALPDQYQVDSAHSLLVPNLDWEKSGMYSCSLIDAHSPGNNLVLSAEVVTVGNMSCPSLTMEHQENETITLRCSVLKTGALIPSLQLWKGQERLNSTIISEGTTDSTTPSVVEISHDMFLHEHDDGAEITCTVAFTTSSGGQPPNYSDTCSETLHVTYSARDVAIYPESVLYMLYEGDMFSCSARGNPEPSFKWNKITGNGNPESMEGPQLIVTSSMVGQNVYECIAMNLVNGTMHNVTTQVSFTVYTRDNQDNGGSGNSGSGYSGSGDGGNDGSGSDNGWDDNGGVDNGASGLHGVSLALTFLLLVAIRLTLDV